MMVMPGHRAAPAHEASRAAGAHDGGQDLAWRGAWQKEMENQQAQAWLGQEWQAGPRSAPTGFSGQGMPQGARTTPVAVPAAAQQPAFVQLARDVRARAATGTVQAVAEPAAPLVSQLPSPALQPAVFAQPARQAWPRELTQTLVQVLVKAFPGEQVELDGGMPAAGAGGSVAAVPAGERQPVRLHAEWSGAGVTLWLGLDEGVAASGQALALARQLRRELAAGGMRVLSITCNGRKLDLDLDHGAAAPPPITSRTETTWQSTQ